MSKFAKYALSALLSLVFANGVIAAPLSGKEITECDRLAADPEDRNRVSLAVFTKEMSAVAALKACQSAYENDPTNLRLTHQYGRALLVNDRMEGLEIPPKRDTSRRRRPLGFSSTRNLPPSGIMKRPFTGSCAPPITATKSSRFWLGGCSFLVSALRKTRNAQFEYWKNRRMKEICRLTHSLASISSKPSRSRKTWTAHIRI